MDVDLGLGPFAEPTAAEPVVDDPDFTLWQGDAADVLATLPDGSVDCVVTSPPYWGLRDYSTDGQLGLEATPDAYVESMVEVFREVRRVLAGHGTCWLNMGDSYAGSVLTRPFRLNDGRDSHADVVPPSSRDVPYGLKPKDLVGIPWRLAFALQADGWWLRSDIVWSKPNPMPESVTDRPTKAHEYVFLLTKQARYFFDSDAVREPHGSPWIGRDATVELKANGDRNDLGTRATTGNPAGRNIRSVWEIATHPYPDAHFATYPPALVERCLKAGCPARVCRECGKPSERITERQPLVLKEPAVPISERRGDGVNDKRTALSGTQLIPASATTVGFTDCGHGNWRPGIVLDPFLGSGTTAHVARRLGYRCVGIELNPEYVKLILERMKQLSLLA